MEIPYGEVLSGITGMVDVLVRRVDDGATRRLSVQLPACKTSGCLQLNFQAFDSTAGDVFQLVMAQRADGCTTRQLARLGERSGVGDRACIDIVQTAGNSPPNSIQYGIDRFWCGSSGIYLEGWVFDLDAPVERLLVITGRHQCAIMNFLNRPPPTVTAHPASGFRLYVPWRASDTLLFEVTAGSRTSRFPIELPEGVVSSPAWSHADDPPPQPGVFGAEGLHAAYQTMIAEANERGFVVAEVGSRNVSPGAVSKRSLFPGASRYIGIDVHPAPNVDIAGDAHVIDELLGPASVDLIFSIAVMEHLAYPWMFAAAVNRALRTGGLTYHATHQAWPVHEQPNDFWRFTDSSMRVLFGADTGFEIIYAGMHNPMTMMPTLRNPASMDVAFWPGYGGVFVLARKIREIAPDAVRWPVTSDQSQSLAALYPNRN